MKSVFITTVVGKNRPHLIRSLAESTRDIGGEWLTSKLMKLDAHFTAMMKVSIDSEKVETLKKALEEEYSELSFSYADVRDPDQTESKPLNLEVDCKDRPGLTHDISKVLSDLNLEPENLEFHRLPVAPVGGTVYSAKVSVCIPEDMSQELLIDSIEAISDCSRVNII